MNGGDKPSMCATSGFGLMALEVNIGTTAPVKPEQGPGTTNPPVSVKKLGKGCGQTHGDGPPVIDPARTPPMEISGAEQHTGTDVPG